MHLPSNICPFINFGCGDDLTARVSVDNGLPDVSITVRCLSMADMQNVPVVHGCFKLFYSQNIHARAQYLFSNIVKTLTSYKNSTQRGIVLFYNLIDVEERIISHR